MVAHRVVLFQPTLVVQQQIEVAVQLAPALTGPGDKVVAAFRCDRKERAMFLENGASAGSGDEHSLEADIEPLLVDDFQAEPGVLTADDGPGEGLKKHVFHGWRGVSRKHRSRFWRHRICRTVRWSYGAEGDAFRKQEIFSWHPRKVDLRTGATRVPLATLVAVYRACSGHNSCIS